MMNLWITAELLLLFRSLKCKHGVLLLLFQSNPSRVSLEKKLHWNVMFNKFYKQIIICLLQHILLDKRSNIILLFNFCENTITTQDEFKKKNAHLIITSTNSEKTVIKISVPDCLMEHLEGVDSKQANEKCTVW